MASRPRLTTPTDKKPAPLGLHTPASARITCSSQPRGPCVLSEHAPLREVSGLGPMCGKTVPLLTALQGLPPGQIQRGSQEVKRSYTDTCRNRGRGDGGCSYNLFNRGAVLPSTLPSALNRCLIFFWGQVSAEDNIL